MYPLSNRDAVVIALCVGTFVGLAGTMLVQFGVEYWRHARRARAWRLKHQRQQKLALIKSVRRDLRSRIRRAS